MMNPISSDDDWNDLARELGVEKSPPAALPEAPHPPDMVERQLEAEQLQPHHGMDERVEAEVVAEGEPELMADEELLEADDAAVAEAGAGEPPTTGRKRRRRRRRRRKGGGAADTPTAATPAATTAATETPSATDDETDLRDEDEAELSSRDEGEDEAPRLGAEDDTASEVLRELIANWNVPSWDEIVSGLYRPN
ncbi:MAG: hypothetical protein RMJ56_05870 [Gemmataceae bacterium]|nr:hypothetical protein [Gemmata sp.]MDW8197116.1 hypothetical protein [Gemmataceae bacterium]